MNTYYVVTGRIPFDDEDTVFVCEAKDMDEAGEKFHYFMLEQNDGDSPEHDDEGKPIVYVMAYIRVEAEKMPVVEWSN